MLNRIITLSLEQRFVVIALAVILAVAGFYSARRLDIDAFPDTTPVMVQINTVAPALGPLEIERQITFPIEQSIAGLPGMIEVRSVSKFGFSQVNTIFEDGIDVYFARQLINERLGTVELPEGIERPQMGPVSTGLGEIYHYIISSPNGEKTLEELTTIHDWIIKPQLRSVPGGGVAEINTWGGETRQYHVLIDPERLLQHDLTMDDAIEALQRNNMNVGGGNIVQAGESQIVQGVSLTTNIEQIGDVVITAVDGVPIRIRDVGEVAIGHEIRRGAATAQGRGEIVLGLAFMLMGENSHDVASRLDQRLTEIRKTLPEGVDVRPVYQRTELVDQVIHTVAENLAVGAILVVAVLFMFLGDLRAGLLVALAIPLSMLFAANLMLQVGITASLMSLGAIDFGLVVDSSVIMIENNMRRLALEGGTRSKLDIVRDASIEVRKPTMFGELIIMIVYLPILTLEGIEGKLFRPMALTVIFALAGSLVLSLTLMPALASLILPSKAKHRENMIVRAAQWTYRPILNLALRMRALVIAGAVVLVTAGAWLASQLGSEFIPRLSEGAITMNLVRLAGVSLEESVRYGTQLEQLVLEKFPDEVRDIWTRTGTAEVATDPMGIELSDMFIMLKPRAQWKRAATQQELVERIRDELEGMPGMRVVFSQPIEMRMNEMIAGVRTDLGIKIFGDDLEVLKSKAAEVQTILEGIRGSADIYVEQLTGQPMLEIVINQEAIARYGVPAEHVLELVEAIGEIKVGEIREPQRQFDLALRLPEAYRRDVSTIANILVPTSRGERLPLSSLAEIRETEGPSTITRKWQKRRIVVQCNVSGRDLAGFVEQVRTRIDAELDLPPGYHVAFGGQFEHLERAQARLAVIVPLALLLIFMLLYLSVNSVGDALIIFTAAPFAAVGGILALWLFDMPFTISAAVGFIAVSGVAMLNGLVLVSTTNQNLASGMNVTDAIYQAGVVRLRPILMTALVAALGFVPMALNTHIGAEVQRPLATVVIAGVIAANILTLLVLPALLAMFKLRGSLPWPVSDAPSAKDQRSEFA